MVLFNDRLTAIKDWIVDLLAALSGLAPVPVPVRVDKKKPR